MKYLIQWFLIGVILLIAVNTAGLMLILLSLIFWDRSFINLASKMIDLIVGIKSK